MLTKITTRVEKSEKEIHTLWRALFVLQGRVTKLEDWLCRKTEEEKKTGWLR